MFVVVPMYLAHRINDGQALALYHLMASQSLCIAPWSQRLGGNMRYGLLQEGNSTRNKG